ncbi:bacteriocin [Bombilactobacillus thymidiniphilus]|uniref:Bacteriocin n=1 Tax=Bombilactobacillus thymidiniphilus TaxID=2923363 RepID=A0ABY4PEY1_9LACO|nr:bacteriocin [Bombilactobacillus thymidiniphilus]UQS83862.1 bacteriocin [Bombilactobacillus thymidiniphilus]
MKNLSDQELKQINGGATVSNFNLFCGSNGSVLGWIYNHLKG